MHESLSEVAARLRIPRLADIAPNEPCFAQVEFAVEADRFAQQALWSMWQEGITWDSDTSARTVGLGILIGRNVTVEVRFARLNGHMVMFYNGNSDLVDRTMVNSFVEDVSKLALAANPGSSPAGKTDATNFHNCVRHCTRS
ncbi:hypothetical protein BH11CYA1_BH11CYA1_23520 [soil metagenome]